MNLEQKNEVKNRAEQLASSLKSVNSQKDESISKFFLNPQGIFDAKLVRAIFFVIFFVGLFITASISIASVWAFVPSEFAYRSITTFVIVFIALGIFVVANEALADLVTLWPENKKDSNDTTNNK